MNYIFYLKYQVKLYVFMILTVATTYSIIRYCEWGNPIIVTPAHIAAFVSGTLSFIFIGAYITACQNPFNK